MGSPRQTEIVRHLQSQVDFYTALELQVLQRVLSKVILLALGIWKRKGTLKTAREPGIDQEIERGQGGEDGKGICAESSVGVTTAPRKNKLNPDAPECASEKLTPCSSSDWQQCARCYRIVCLVHDDAYEVYQSGELPYYAADMICPQCVVAGWELGEWTCGEAAQWVNLR